MENASLPVEERSSGGPLAPLRARLQSVRPGDPALPLKHTVYGSNPRSQIKNINSEGEKKALAGEYRKKGRGPAQGGARKSNRLTVMNAFESWTRSKNGWHSQHADVWVMFIIKSWQPIVE